MTRFLFGASLLLVTICWDATAAIERRSVEAQSNLCIDQQTCGACITRSAECGWCQQEGFDARDRPRCDLRTNLRDAGCNTTNIVSPRNEVTSLRNESVRNGVGTEPAIQLQPQQMSLKLRPNKPHKFDLKFRLAEDYPVDLYYVLDLSHSMNDDKANLASLGDQLATSMREITRNFHLGLGTFVDKKTMPFVSVVPADLISPCTGCAAPYGFKNVMPLTHETGKFSREVNDAKISGNLDRPEGGFDAVMQAIVCSLGGIVKPNDGACHLQGGLYSESLNQDYPSISQLSYKVAEHKINIIFAVTDDQKPTYTALSEFLEGSTAGVLSSDGDNIVDLIKDNYEKISSVVEMKTEGSSDISVRFRSACRGTEVNEVSKCSGLRIGESVTFEVELEANRCPENRAEWQKNITIYAVGLNEKLELTIDLQCECDCEQSGAGEENSARCHRNGTFECGACTCNGGHYGRECECAQDSNTRSNVDYESACKMTNTSEICEGNGQCICGTCNCDAISYQDTSKRYSGTFCEYNDYSCDLHDGKLCGGNGQCRGGVCNCHRGYNGTDCGCATSPEPCRAVNGLSCNGQGTCVCGQCACRNNFYGRTCEDCPDCEAKCNQHKDCVQCKAFQSGPMNPTDCSSQCSFVKKVEKYQEDKDVWNTCQFRDDEDCLFTFAYEYDSEVVHVIDTKECPKPVDILTLVLGVVFGIIGAGIIALIIWKVVTTIQDKREIARLEKEKAKSKWGTTQNPIYKQATSTFQNPMYPN